MKITFKHSRMNVKQHLKATQSIITYYAAYRFRLYLKLSKLILNYIDQFNIILKYSLIY